MEQQKTETLDPESIASMLEACSCGNRKAIDALISKNPVYACQQECEMGKSPLMAAAEAGHVDICKLLLEHGAPWNAINRNGQCAGNYATDNQHWEVVNLLVDAGTKAELILGASIRLQKAMRTDEDLNSFESVSRPVEHEPCTKPDYLLHRLSYNSDGTALLDQDNDAVMMEWERPLMEAHASILMKTPGKRILNIGFGMGIIDTAFQKWNPALHIIIEAHPDVYQRMLDEKWDEKPNVRLCFGKWQDVLPKLIQEGVMVDGIFYDTYGEHFLDLEDFHNIMVKMLSKPHGVYSFFNGLAPDNIFFHGVACQCVKLQLGQVGLDAEFLPCELQVEDSVWEGIRRKYWHGRDTYYLPRVTWKQPKQDDDQLVTNAKKDPSARCPNTATAKRQKTENGI